ncbi:hypothetical protein [Paracoccus sp. FO-3]|uniref:hypothetical protein n=1 Tax=Paracoccus sp. FO-3 TaxID=1335059 RepID=UPI001125C7C3|nr:hypothetical protein [Paracoccus sp. FO-3]
MPGKFFVSAALVFIASGAMAQTVALDMPEDQYRGLVEEVTAYKDTDLGPLDAGRIDWLKGACGVIADRETHNAEVAMKAGKSYISVTTLGVCDRVANLSAASE